jgi:hypothetical protein
VRALDAYWQQCPPVARMVAGYLGYKTHAFQSAAADITPEKLVDELGHVPVRQHTPVDDSAFEQYLKDKNGGQ